MNKYQSFYDAIDVKIGDHDIKTWNQLKNIMIRLRFITAKSSEGVTNQVDEAWKHLTGITPAREIRRGTITERRTPTKTTYRTRHEIKIKNKIYKKGTYIDPEMVPQTPYKYIVGGRSGATKQATMGIKYKGKWYRKGQFMPKDFRFD